MNRKELAATLKAAHERRPVILQAGGVHGRSYMADLLEHYSVRKTLGGLNSPFNAVYQPQVLVASYGDSIANISAFANFDLRNLVGNVGFQPERMGLWLPALSGGLIKFIANCGVSGDATAAMIAREVAGSSATRKNIADAKSTGATHIINSMGINDIQQLAGGASQASIDTIVNTAVANCVIILKKQRVANLYSITHSTFGYALSTATASEIATRRVASKQFNDALGPIIRAANGALGSWVDVYMDMADSVGNSKSGMDDGLGLHPSANGIKLVCAKLVDEIFRVSGINEPPLSIYSNSTNLLANPDLSAATSGIATGFNIYTVSGTCSFTNSVIDWRGKNWQEVIVTPSALASGIASIQIDFAIPTAGNTTGLFLTGEMDVYVDDCNGGAPAVFQWLGRIRQNATFADLPSFNGAISPQVNVSEPIDYHVAFPTITIPVTPITTGTLSSAFLTNSLAPFKVRVSGLNVVRVS